MTENEKWSLKMTQNERMYRLLDIVERMLIKLKDIPDSNIKYDEYKELNDSLIILRLSIEDEENKDDSE